MTAPDGLALGRLPTKEDPRTLRLANYLTAALPQPPATVDWTAKVPGWPLFGNDKYGCCTIASAGHIIGCWGANVGEPTDVVSTREVLAGYSAISGFDAGPPTRNDRGAYMLDALNYWRRRGVGAHRNTAYVRLDLRDLVEVRTAISLFGAIYAGLALPTSASSQFRNRKTWGVVAGSTGRRGSWGGHAVGIFGYTANHFTCATWGRLQNLTTSFWRRYSDECYAIVASDFLDVSGHSPQGFDLERLLADLKRITS